MHFFGICITINQKSCVPSYRIIIIIGIMFQGPSEGSPRGPEKVV